MGNYDNIQIPNSGIPISASQFGGRVRAAILGLDTRVTALEGQQGGVVFEAATTSSSGSITTTETVVLTGASVADMRPMRAFKLTFYGVLGGSDNFSPQIRVRKGSTAAGAQVCFARKYKGASAHEVGFVSLFRTDVTSIPSGTSFCCTLLCPTVSPTQPSVSVSASTSQPFGFLIEDFSDASSSGKFSTLPILT